MTIDKFPEDVLLEIFDAYRQDMELQPDYEELWNSKNGWFKLAHVCRSWRRVVLLSPSRLHVHLLFTPDRPSRAIMLKHLPPFPILIDYRAASWTQKEVNLALAVIRHRSRMRGIALRIPYTDTAKLLGALSHPFPELESLEICTNSPYDHGRELVLPATFLSCSAPSLRRLTLLREVAPRCLSPLLSSATGLVELSLTLRTMYSSPPEASLLTNLQRMSCLRHLELNLRYRYDTGDTDPPPPAYAGDVVPLSKLTDIIFTGHSSYLQAIVIGLAAPSLQHLNAELRDLCESDTFFPIPHLCKFIRDTECQFTAVRLRLSPWEFSFWAGTGSQSVYDHPFRITFPMPVSLEQMGQELPGPLSTVEELIITWVDEPWETELEGWVQTDQWRGFFYHVQQVKVVHVPAEVALNVAHSFQQGGGEPVLDLLPTLEQIEVLSAVGRDDLYVSACDAFEPLIAARQREGRPIRLSMDISEE